MKKNTFITGVIYSRTNWLYSTQNAHVQVQCWFLLTSLILSFYERLMISRTELMGNISWKEWAFFRPETDLLSFYYCWKRAVLPITNKKQQIWPSTGDFWSLIADRQILSVKKYTQIRYVLKSFWNYDSLHQKFDFSDWSSHIFGLPTLPFPWNDCCNVIKQFRWKWRECMELIVLSRTSQRETWITVKVTWRSIASV